MCGRYALKTSTPDLARMLGVDFSGDTGTGSTLADAKTGECGDLTNFNIAPTQPVVVCGLAKGAGRGLGWMRWGLVPSWSKDDKGAARMINARSETVHERPAFRVAFQRRRCLLPASGFYEWKREGEQRQPYFVAPAKAPMMVFAGLWERWQRPDGTTLRTCTILTMPAAGLAAEIHPRRPVTLEPEDFQAWLDPAPLAPREAEALYARGASAEWVIHPVSTFVNAAKNNDPRCWEPLGPPLAGKHPSAPA